MGVDCKIRLVDMAFGELYLVLDALSVHHNEPLLCRVSAFLQVLLGSQDTADVWHFVMGLALLVALGSFLMLYFT